MPRRFVFALVVLSLSGCALVEVEPDPASPFYAVPAGSVVELHRSITIRPGSTRVWLQRGQPGVGQDWWHPACNLEVNTLDRERAQTVAPGRFEVIRVQQMEDYARLQTPPMGAITVALRTDYGDDGGVTWMWLGYHLWLRSAEQPDVRRLTCVGSYARPFEVRPPSIAQIREALGTVASLHLP